jgi:hypothetical protein
MTSAQTQFASKVAELIKQSKALAPAARKNVIEMLDAARKQILGQIASLDPSSFSALQLNALKHSIDRVMDEFRQQATNAIQGLEEAAFSTGAATVAQPLAAIGLDSGVLGIAQVSRTTLSIAQSYTADLIGGLAKDSAARLNASIQRAFLGGQQITDIIQQIGKALNHGEGFTGFFGPIGKRATAISINEVLRVHSIAAQARLEDAAQRHPDLEKEWDHINVAKVPRVTHLAADGQVRKVDEAFLVGGEQLMYPRDPNGSAENTIGCHCMMKPRFPASALKATSADRDLLGSLGISVSAA